LAAICCCPTSAETQTQTLLGEQTIVLWSLVTHHCRHQYGRESYRRYDALENTASDYHPAFSFIQLLLVKKAAQENFTYFSIVIIFITGQLPELPCSMLAEK